MKHPLHPAIVHFPIACWMLATFADISSLWLGRQVWWWSGVTLCIGTVAGVFAMLSGMVELLKLADRPQALGTAERHMQLMLLAWTLYAASLLARLDHFSLTAPGWLEMSLSCLGLATLFAGAWLGAQLVYRHGVGTFTP
ncbi:DUF2231 domain-containing protein [Methylotenera sp. G11]|uniref:DUF2231 domain-containing protein n=1 Tax=Methylotenera sp. G11 TaxID=1506585 RepID=UPI000646E8D4|nr:DUF2231 domain-containing protein [Methylotenera sp. G11]